MRIKRAFLFAFLLVLYISPLFFAGSYGRAGIATEPNMQKDFTLAVDWYDIDWTRRKIINLYGSVGVGVDYQVRIDVIYDSDMQDDFDDIRFTDDDKMTLLSFWRESYVVNTSAIFWVKVTDDLDSNQDIYMYYGNSTVSTTSDGEATFLLFDDFNDASFDTAKWDLKNNQPVEAGGVITCETTATEGFASDDSFTYGRIRSNAKFTADITDSYFGKWGFLGDWGGGDTASTSFWQYDTTTIRARTTSYSHSLVGDYNATYHTYQINWFTSSAEYIIDDNSLLSLSSGVYDGPSYASGYMHDADGLLSIDWIFVAKIDSDYGYGVTINFGTEEIHPDAPLWREAGVAISIFFLPIDPASLWALNNLYILLGAGLVIGCGVYLVKGGKNDLSMNKFYYVIVAFLIGWALIIGGVMP